MKNKLTIERQKELREVIYYFIKNCNWTLNNFKDLNSSVEIDFITKTYLKIRAEIENEK